MPVDNSIRFAGQHKANLHILPDEHRLSESVNTIGTLFAHFLDSLKTQGYHALARRTLCLAVIVVTILGLTSISTASEGDSFPLRPYYPEVPYITTEDLMDEYYSTRVVDIRSKFEYDVARINRAFLLPLNDPAFPEKLAKLRPKDDPTPLVFYCNGHTCAKSYQAAQLALSLGFVKVFVYDGGIFDWIQAAPDMATLMGETPARTERVITDSRFLDRL